MNKARVPSTRLHAARVLAGLSQVELARRIGRSRNWVSEKERCNSGAPPVTPKDAAALAAALGVPVEDLFTMGKRPKS